MRRLACLVVAAGVLAGCGGDLQPTQKQTQAAARVATATVTVAATPAATATPTASATAPPATTATPDASGGGQSADGAAPSQSTPAPRPVTKRKLSAPMACLRAAKLDDALKRGATLWSAKAPSGKHRVTIDGPYKTAHEARDSVETLLAIEDAEVGGRYVVSAPLLARAAATVKTLADCLDTRAA